MKSRIYGIVLTLGFAVLAPPAYAQDGGGGSGGGGSGGGGGGSSGDCCYPAVEYDFTPNGLSALIRLIFPES